MKKKLLNLWKKTTAQFQVKVVGGKNSPTQSRSLKALEPRGQVLKIMPTTKKTPKVTPKKSVAKKVISKKTPKKAVKKSAKTTTPKKAAVKKATTKKNTKKAPEKKPLVFAPDHQSFWVANGEVLNSLLALRDALSAMEKEVYHYHVSKEHNDFASWVDAVLCDAKCAKDLAKAATPTKAKTVVVKRLKVYSV